MVEKVAELRSPCIGQCVLDSADICTGCFRSGMEIAEWGVLSDDEKRSVLSNVRQRRAVQAEAEDNNARSV